jgi:hypothetical protein
VERLQIELICGLRLLFGVEADWHSPWQPAAAQLIQAFSSTWSGR